MDRRIVAAALALLACGGLMRLEEDGTAPFRLPAEDPLNSLNARLVDQTGGDDLVAIVLVDERTGQYGLLDEAGVALVEQARVALSSARGLERVRAVTTAPILSGADGLITASTPLAPAPSDAPAWAAARSAVLGDSFVHGQLLSADGRLAVVPGWIWRGDADEALVRTAMQALAVPETRSSPAGAVLQKAVADARLAVVLKQEPGPPDAAVARALRSSTTPLALRWVQDAARLAANPEAAAVAGARAALADLDAPAGIRLGLAGPSISEDVVARTFPLELRALLALMLALAAAAAFRSRGAGGALSSALGGSLAFAGTLGICGWLGAPLQPWVAVVALLASGWVAVLPTGGGGTRGLVLGSLAALPALAVLGTGGGEGATEAVVGAAIVTGILTWGLGGPAETPAPRPIAGHARGLMLFVALLALFPLRDSEIGLDPARILGPRNPVGQTTADLATRLGTAPAAFVVASGEPGDLAQPAWLGALTQVGRSLQADEAVADTRSWSDFVARLHGAVSGGEDELPDSHALVEQYLLMFGRPNETRPLVSADRSLGAGFVRLEPGGGAALGRLAETHPAGPGAVGLAGRSVAMGRAARDRARAGAKGLGLSMVLLLAGLAWLRRSAVVLDDAALCLAAAAVGLLGGALALGSISVPALTASGIGAGLAAALRIGGPDARIAVLTLGLGLAAAAAASVGLLAAVGLGVGAALGTALLLDRLSPVA